MLYQIEGGKVWLWPESPAAVCLEIWQAVALISDQRLREQIRHAVLAVRGPAAAEPIRGERAIDEDVPFSSRAAG